MGWQKPEQWWSYSCNGAAEVKGECRVGAWADLGGWTKSRAGQCNKHMLWSCHRTKRNRFCWKWRSWLHSVSGLVALAGDGSCYPIRGEDENVEIGSKKAMVFPLKSTSEDLTMVSQPLGSADQFYSICFLYAFYSALYKYCVINHSKCN